jgi:EAL domain-containing protein (putative c-di-GMP-specific phosphodiesterase class I)
MATDSPLVDFDAICQRVRAAVEPNRTHAVSLHDAAGDVLWMSEGSMGPDEHNVVHEAAEAFTDPSTAAVLAFDLGDARSAVMLRAVNSRRAIVGLAMIIMDTRIVSQGASKLLTPKMQKALVMFARMCPEPEPAPAPEPKAHSSLNGSAHSHAHPHPTPKPPHAPMPAAAARPAPMAVEPKTIAAQLEEIVARSPPRPSTPRVAAPSRPASFVSHVSPQRPATAASVASPARPAPSPARPAPSPARPAASPARPAASPARPAASPARPAPTPPAPVEIELPAQKSVPPEIDRLNAEMRNSPIVLHVQRLVPLSKGGQLKRYEVLLRSGSETSPSAAAPHEMLKAAVENGLGSMIDRRVITELVGWLVRHPESWRANEVMFSVNLTSTALHDEHFIKFIELCLAKASLPKGTIAFEIDATTALTLADKIREVVAALHRLDCPLVLDDFALRTECFELLRLPGVRYVKLAPEITSKMRIDKVAQATITGVVQMARVLGMHTCAKRSDTPAEQEWLTALGVDFVQSNNLSPPVSIDTLRKDSDS